MPSLKAVGAAFLVAFKRGSMLFPDEIKALPDEILRMPSNDREHPLASAFRTFIQDPSFPCVGAKSAMSRGRLVTIVARNIDHDADDVRIHRALLGFIARFKAHPDMFQSFAVIFKTSTSRGEQAFERNLWARAQAVCDQDAILGHPWDKRVASDAENPHFSLSVAGEAFFIVGLHPEASRPARRFAAPVLVFNLHDQFERLREAGRYEKLRAAIIKRDIELAGSSNPMIARHGSSSEARQYSGRLVEDGWRCPFRDPNSETSRN